MALLASSSKLDRMPDIRLKASCCSPSSSSSSFSKQDSGYKDIAELGREIEFCSFSDDNGCWFVIHAGVDTDGNGSGLIKSSGMADSFYKRNGGLI